MNTLSLRPPRTAFCLVGMASALLTLSGCLRVPAVLEAYVLELPKRGDANGAYSSLEPELRGSLVLADAAAACSVDTVNDIAQESSAACRCTRSSLADWQSNCKSWLSGESTPTDTPAPKGK
jgi:ABC-type uncharacterized transport system auxiliary subunit